MLKKHKRIVSYFMVIIMALMGFAPTSVNASSIQLLENPSSIDLNSNVLYSVCGEDIPASLSNDLDNMNITVENNTLVEYISSKNNNVADTMVVTNIDGESMERTFITSLTSDDTTTYSETNEGKAWTPSPMGDSFTLLIMVQYNKFSTDLYGIYYYQPVYATFIYYDNDNLYTVKSIEVDYQCGGYEYEIERDEDTDEVIGYTPLTSGSEQYIHNITISVTSPRKNTYFPGNNPYNTDRVIDTNFGLYASHLLFYEIYMTEAGSNEVFRLNGALEIDQIW